MFVSWWVKSVYRQKSGTKSSGRKESNIMNHSKCSQDSNDLGLDNLTEAIKWNQTTGKYLMTDTNNQIKIMKCWTSMIGWPIRT